jgi:hypothetical protein
MYLFTQFMVTIIGFVGFVANLLNGQRPKNGDFSSACECIKLSFSFWVPQKLILKQALIFNLEKGLATE